MEETKDICESTSALVATDEDDIECEGDFCNHSSFKRTAKGCNSITRLCPVCNKALCGQFEGKQQNIKILHIKLIFNKRYEGKGSL